MTIDFEDDSGGKLDLPAEEIAQQVISGTLDFLNCPYEASVGLQITDDDGIHALNLSYRRIDSATDVLSFPLIDFPVPGKFDFLEYDDVDAFDPDSGELTLGDIVISADRVIVQAESYGHSVKREYAFLITHSMLHLLGYDHMTKEDAAAMEGLQGKILEQLHILR